jgi:DNA modification methylase
LFSFPEDVVADPFVGRGTTAAVAARLGRVAWASDRDPEAMAAARDRVARERWQLERTGAARAARIHTRSS